MEYNQILHLEIKVFNVLRILDSNSIDFLLVM